jgi:hypothetical protein
MRLNQKGQALIAVMVLSIFFVASYVAFQSYFQTLANVQIQYREGINLMDAVDKASTDIRAAWDKASVDATAAWLLVNPPGTYPTPTYIQTNYLVAFPATYFPTLDPSCSGGAPGCTAAHCCPGTAILCYNNPSNSDNPYCFFNSSAPAPGNTTASLDFRLVLPEKKKPGTLEKYFNKTGEMIANFVLKIRGQGLIESKSLALPTSVVGRTDNVGAAPTCLTAQCITCGLAANPLNPVCATIYACPTSFPQCSAYNAAPSPGSAIFVQQFSLTPIGGL